MKIKDLYQCLENYRKATKVLEDHKKNIKKIESFMDSYPDADRLIAESEWLIKESERIIKECGDIEV